ncbi:glycosyltransferase family 4 protein [Microbacterium luteolum]|uniref:D-inositol 3-phosphate glycosyltransferase n=1 Tax=Microbacterium luteolum TaxID=69367 RepID=A0ABY7XP05_MICLT|nr:glycosyltransferase family 4 protein [Microbacterium luteolum]WDM43742.1 glycosyltransferase family 4 protein [Microbacterium luteolum]
MTSLRVTIVSRIYRPEPSAASMFLGSVADELTAEGHAVRVLTARLPGRQKRPSSAEDVRDFPVVRDKQGYLRGYIPYLSFDIPLAFRLLFTPRPDVVFMEPPPTTGVVVRIICALRRIPYVYDAADIWSDAAHQATGSSLVIRVLRGMERFGMNGARRLVTISQGVVDRVQALGVRRPIVVTGFGADTSAFASDAAAPVERLFVYAGSYSPWHGAEALADAFAIFSREHPGYILRFIGNGSERDLIAARADELGIGRSVEFVDAVPAEELAPHLHAAVASLATLRPGTSYEYAFTTKAYSSLAAGCPVIFAGPGPTAQFISEANRAVRAGVACAHDAGQIAAAMTLMATDPLSTEERSALARWTAEEHSLAAVARRVVVQIESAATESRR